MPQQQDPYSIDIPSALWDVRIFTAEICNRTGRWMPGRPGSFADVRLSRAKLIFEEYAETRAAIDAGDTEGELDGMVDLLYVVLGLYVELNSPVNADVDFALESDASIEHCLAFAMLDVGSGFDFTSSDSCESWLCAAMRTGLPVGAAWNEVHAANMRKFQGGHYDAAAGKWKKPADWVGPDIAGVLAKYPRIKR